MLVIITCILFIYKCFVILFYSFKTMIQPDLTSKGSNTASTYRAGRGGGPGGPPPGPRRRMGGFGGGMLLICDYITMHQLAALKIDFFVCSTGMFALTYR